jgi:hypothetical protein
MFVDEIPTGELLFAPINSHFANKKNKQHMKKIKFILAFSIVPLLSFQSSVKHAESVNLKVMLESGDAKEFKTHPVINLKVTYDDLKVGDFNSEAQYTKKKVKDLNSKESGKGDTWLMKWENAKENVWPERFELMYNKVLEKKANLKCDRNSTENEYTLMVNVTFIEPGFNVGVASKPAAASFEFNLVKTSNPSESLAKLYVNNVPGAQAMGYDFDSDTRVGESFAKGAKMLAAYILKQK